MSKLAVKRPYNRAGRHGRAFTADEIRLIRQEVEAGRPRVKIAISRGVNKETIDRIANGETYGWVPQEAEIPYSEEQEAALVAEAKASGDAFEEMMKAEGFVLRNGEYVKETK